MSRIGHFTREAEGLVGSIQTLTLSCKLTLAPAESSNAENAPDYRVHHGSAEGPEIGAGWKRTGERAGDYIALVIDDPALAQPIRANLFRDDDAGTSWSLHWSRQTSRGGKG